MRYGYIFSPCTSPLPPLFISVSLHQGCTVLQVFHTCCLRVSDTSRVMLQSNCARLLAVNLHSELGEDKEKYLALGKRDGPKISSLLQ